jgi:hypothetical protein
MPEFGGLIERYRRGALSRRDLTAGLAVATAGLAGSTAAFGAVGTEPRWTASAPSRRDFLPAVSGAGLDDHQPIQDAIDAAAAAGGGRVLIEGHLETGSTLIMKSGVELAGICPAASSLSAHASFGGSVLVATQASAGDVRFRDLAFDSRGLASSAILKLGDGANRVAIEGCRLTGWTPAIPWVIGIRVDAPPGPVSSYRSIEQVLIDGCDFDSLGTGVKISQGASHISVSRSRFVGMHRRALWLTGAGELASSHIHVVDNRILDIPEDPNHSQPIKIGEDGDRFHTYVHVSGNVVIGNGSFNGPGGQGAGDHYSLHCLRHSWVVCNASVDSSECGFVAVDAHDLIHLANTSVASDAGGFALKGKMMGSRRNSYIGNYAWNNGQNRQGRTGIFPWVFSGFRVHDGGAGVIDTSYIGNYAWDSQAVKTQQYGLAIAHPTVTLTTLTGNTWRANQHKFGALYNRGQATKEGSYQSVPQTP